MIRWPRVGQAVVPHYRASARSIVTTQGRPGVVAVVGRGPGPRNVGVRLLDTGELVVIPRGNLNQFPRPVV